jgi:DNA polymerase phi
MSKHAQASNSVLPLHTTKPRLSVHILPLLQVLQQQPEAEQGQQQQQQHGRAAPDQQQLANLMQHFVDASCLNSSHERKALALQLLQLLLPVLTPEAVPVLLSRPLLGCINTALRNKDSYLHASARKSMVSGLMLLVAFAVVAHQCFAFCADW